MRKRPAWIERQRSENRKNLLGEKRVQLRALLQAEVRKIQQADMAGLQRRNQILPEEIVRPADQAPNYAANRFQRLRRAAAIQAGLLDAVFDLLRQAGDAHHEELVDVRAEDRQEFHALQQRIAAIAGLLQHAPLELQMAEFPIQV